MQLRFLEGNLSADQLAHKERLVKALQPYLPAPAVEPCAELIMKYNLHLHLEVERKDRLGDYHPHLGKGNRITINHNLNPFDFLVTFLHELAHHTTYKLYGSHHQPHGKEWKEEFRKQMRPFVAFRIFPHEIEQALVAHMRHPAYTHTGDVALMKALSRYNTKQEGVFLEDLAPGSTFKMSGKSRIVMIKMEKRRTYYACKSVANGKAYLVHGAARVVPVDQP